jgi:hypothetical protein
MPPWKPTGRCVIDITCHSWQDAYDIADDLSSIDDEAFTTRCDGEHLMIKCDAANAARWQRQLEGDSRVASVEVATEFAQP